MHLPNHIAGNLFLLKISAMNMHKAYKNYNLGFGTIFLNLPVQSHTYLPCDVVHNNGG